jgi:hypothetical protein
LRGSAKLRIESVPAAGLRRLSATSGTWLRDSLEMLVVTSAVQCICNEDVDVEPEYLEVSG